MKKTALILFLGISIMLTPPAFADNPTIDVYQIYLEAGQRALRDGKYERARLFFESAHMLYPQEAQALSYINLIKRMTEGQVTGDISLAVASASVRTASEEPSVYLPPLAAPSERREDAPHVEDSDTARARVIDEALRTYRPSDDEPYAVVLPDTRTMPPPHPEPASEPTVAMPLVSSAIPSLVPDASTQEIRLEEELWARQPNTVIEVPLGQRVFLIGRNIQRYLVVTQDTVVAERVDKDVISVAAVKRGSTFLHVWDETGRWTFHIEVTMPFRDRPRDDHKATDPLIVTSDPFRFTYANTWSSFHSGEDLDKIERTHLIFRQWMGIDGETPYGDVYGYANFYKFAESTELTSYSTGLVDGKIGPFEDFSVRAFDTNKRFSNLSLPGRYFRGVVLDAKAFHERIAYSLIYGQDRAIVSYLTPGTQDLIQSYLEGARVTLFPNEERNYSLNVVRGYGEARPADFPEQVLSVETSQKVGDWRVHAEAADDQNTQAQLVQSRWYDDDQEWQINFRNIEKNFSTITGRPAAQGEAGGNVRWHYNEDRYRVQSNLDVYRDRQLPNPDNEDALNLQWHGNLDVPLTDTARINSSLFYDYAPQLLSPRENIRLHSRYLKDLKVWDDMRLSYYFGAGWQENLYENFPAQDFQRTSATAGMRLGLTEYLSVYSNYEYSWLQDRETEEKSNPKVLNSGLNYSRPITDSVSGHFYLSYRDEEDTEQTFSFLAGEDSIRGSLGFSYHPEPTTEIFIDSSLQKVWSEEEHDRQMYEGDIRLGLRKTWDLPIHWSPGAVIEGRVYKDYEDMAADSPEGVAGVMVRVGHREVVTDEQGVYRVHISAEKVRVMVIVSSIPKGFVLSTPMVEDVEIEQGRTVRVDFGLTSRSGIYGVVFVDENGNGQPDRDEKLLPRVRMLLGDRSALTDTAGGYFFEKVPSGIHKVRIDINSLSLEYVPLVPVSADVTVGEGETAVYHVPVKMK